MKVLLIRTGATTVSPSTYNLQEIGLSRALTRRGHQCGIVYYTDGNPSDEVLSTDFGNINIYWRSAHKIAGDALFEGIDELINAYDVIQVAEYDRLQSVSIYRRMKNVVVYHGPYAMPLEATHGGLHRVKSALFDMKYTRRNKNASVQVLAKSELAGTLLRKKGFSCTKVVGVGLDSDMFADAPDPLGSESTFNLLSVGRFDKNKNTLFMLDVYEEVLKQLNDIHLCVIGTGTGRYADAVRRRMADGCFSGKLTHLESVKQSEIPAYYKTANLLLLPSIYEIFGMVLLEAGWFGCPIVSSVNGGSLTLSKGCEVGKIIPGFDAKEWADCICSLLTNDARRYEISRQLKQHIRDRWTWDALADTFISAYERACSNA